MRGDYQKFVGLVNEGAKGMGFADAGQMRRSAMTCRPNRSARKPTASGNRSSRCTSSCTYARGKLDKTYGKDKAEVGNGLIAAHLLGNMWQQDWSNLWDQLEPYPGAGSLDITAALEKQYQTNLSASLAKAGKDASVAAQYKAQREAELRTAKQMTERAQDFYACRWACRRCRSRTGNAPSSSSPTTAMWSATPAPGT